MTAGVPDADFGKILHQVDTEEVINAEIAEANVVANAVDDATYARKGVTVVASPVAPGATYSQAEAAELKTAIDAIRAALTASGITA